MQDALQRERKLSHAKSVYLSLGEDAQTVASDNAFAVFPPASSLGVKYVTEICFDLMFLVGRENKLRD